MKDTSNRYQNKMRKRPALLDDYMKEEKGQYQAEEKGGKPRDLEESESKPKKRLKMKPGDNSDNGDYEPKKYAMMSDDEDEETLGEMGSRRKRRKRVMFE